MPAWALIATFFVLGGYLLVDRGGFLIDGLLAIVPWLFIAACPLIHVFMHKKHAGHRRDQKDEQDKH